MILFSSQDMREKKEGEREWSDMKEGRKGGEEAWNTLRQAEETIQIPSEREKSIFDNK